MTDEEKEDLRRQLTRQIGGVQKQLHEREAWLADPTMLPGRRVLASCSAEALRMELLLLHRALIEDIDEPGYASLFGKSEEGTVQGCGNMAAPDEIRSASLVKMLRETPWLSAMRLPWSWEFSAVKGSLLQRSRSTANGRFLLIDGTEPPAIVAYLTRAGALFPALVREVIALRIAAVPFGVEPDYQEADKLLRL